MGYSHVTYQNSGAGYTKPLYLPYNNAMRTLAVTAVIFVHVQAVISKTVGKEEVAWWIAQSISAATRWCVPVFLMLSGALLLDTNRNESAKYFYLKRLDRIAIPLVFWSIFYFIWRSQVLGEQITPRIVLSGLLQGSPMFHLWFIFAISWIYLFTPTIRVWIRHSNGTEQLTAALLCLGASSIAVVSWVVSGKMGWRIPSNSVMSVEWVFYLGYFLLGYRLRHVRLSLPQSIVVGVIWFVTVAISAIGYGLCVRYNQPLRGEGMFHCMVSPLVAVISICIFLLIATIFGRESPSFLKWLNQPVLGQASFGVYLTHVAVMQALLVLGWNQWVGSSAPSLFILGIGVLACSFAVTWVLGQIPFFAKDGGLLNPIEKLASTAVQEWRISRFICYAGPIPPNAIYITIPRGK